MRILMVGFGNVGRAFARIVWRERNHHPGLAALDLTVAGVFTRTHGALVNPAGVDVVRALDEVQGTGRFLPDNPDASTLPVREAIRMLEYDVLVELSVLQIALKGEPALSFVREALKRGKHVVTANKGPVAFAHRELSGLARERGCAFRFESAVMDGAPLFAMARASLRGCVVSDVSGVVNSTTNFVLEQMESGVSREDAVAEAQREGFAEADPTYDLEGWDAAAKATVLANALMDGSMTPFDVERTGVMGVGIEELRSARDRGRRLRLVAHAWRDGEGVRARVAPQEFPLDHPFASTALGGSVLRIETDLMGPILVMQENPTLDDTAYGVINDLIALSEGGTL